MAEADYQARKDDGYLTIALLIDGYQGAVNSYVDYYQLTFPVLNDETFAASIGMGAGGAVVPFYVLLDRDMTVRYSGGSPPPATALDEAMAEPWPEDALWPQQLTPEQSDADPLGDAGYSGSSPFLIDAGSVYGEGSTCTTAGNGRPSWAAIALLASLVPALLHRRRR